MKGLKLILFTSLFSPLIWASEKPSIPTLQLWNQPGFFRFSYDNIAMPNNISRMGLLGLNYFVDFTPTLYGGLGAYGAVTGSQGGLFTLGIAGGAHYRFTEHWLADAGLFVGGGGGRSSLVGGGLMLRPNVGLQYDLRWTRLGMHYSYIDFLDGQIRGSSLGVDIDFPYDFYYVSYPDVGYVFHVNQIQLMNGKYLAVQRNDFGLFLQAYFQKTGTKSVDGQVQDNTMGLVGAELDHYLNENVFWSLHADGAFRGVPNGYMDVLGGLGYRFSLASYLALLPQLNIGVGGGGNVDTGGGVLIQPQVSLQWPLTTHFAARLGGGYLWSPQGQLKAATLMGTIFYHLDLASGSDKPIAIVDEYKTQGWRIHLFNQTYIHPQRVNESTTSPDNLVGVQLDQLFTPNFFLVYQAASAYQGVHAGGLASGMIGAGLQTNELFHHHLQPFAELLIGAAGGGGLKIGGGAIIEPVIGLHYAVTSAVGLQASVGEIKALHDSMNTPVVNVGVTIRFGVLEGCLH